METGEIDEAIVLCDKQQGSVANSIKSALVKYQAVKRRI
jgi:biopolymer transport protein ExbB